MFVEKQRIKVDNIISKVCKVLVEDLINFVGDKGYIELLKKIVIFSGFVGVIVVEVHFNEIDSVIVNEVVVDFIFITKEEMFKIKEVFGLYWILILVEEVQVI